MSQERKVIVYGASGYTGKLVVESLASRRIPLYVAGRNQEKLEKSLEVVKERLGENAWKLDAEVAVVNNTEEELVALFEKADVVINVVGPFMQLGWPVVEACLKANCHYLDTTGEQDWTRAIGEQYGSKYAEKNLLLAPATAFMWAAGALAAEVVMEDPDIDSLDILYQVDNGLPSEASTKSFLRMVCNGQYYLEQNEFKLWPNDVAYDVFVPYRNAKLSALPWSGACEPIWFQNRLRNCKVLTAIGEHIVPPVLEAINAFNEQTRDMDQEGKEAFTNAMGDQMMAHEPPKDDLDVQRSCITVLGQGRIKTAKFVLNVSAAYTWTGEICAEGAERILNGQLKEVGFQSAAKAFGHRELIRTFNHLGFCSALPE